MRKPEEHFGGQELELVFVAARLDEALQVEKVLDDASIDYLVETDTYKGGVIFSSERVGAFFYAAPGDVGTSKDVIRAAGYRPYDLTSR